MTSKPEGPSGPVPRDSTGRFGLARSETLLGAGVLVAALALMVTLVAMFWKPAPPQTLIVSTGPEDGAYHEYGKRYQEILARSGVQVVLRT